MYEPWLRKQRKHEKNVRYLGLALVAISEFFSLQRIKMLSTGLEREPEVLANSPEAVTVMTKNVALNALAFSPHFPLFSAC